jgi:hypothetical protein
MLSVCSLRLNERGMLSVPGALRSREIPDDCNRERVSILDRNSLWIQGAEGSSGQTSVALEFRRTLPSSIGVSSFAARSHSDLQCLAIKFGTCDKSPLACYRYSQITNRYHTWLGNSRRTLSNQTLLLTLSMCRGTASVVEVSPADD